MTTTPPTHVEPTRLSPAELSRLVDLVTAQIEWHEQEVKRLECLKKRIKRKNKLNRPE